MIRESLSRLPAEARVGTTGVVGAYWTRTNDPEIDIVVADRAPVADRIEAVGSIKWLENKPFDDQDLAALITHRAQLPGASAQTPMIAVARSGSTAGGITALGPADLLEGWRRHR